MFKCEDCGKTTQAGEKQTKRTENVRRKQYYNEFKQVVAEGFEIVKEINVCADCSGLGEVNDQAS